MITEQQKGARQYLIIEKRYGKAYLYRSSDNYMSYRIIGVHVLQIPYHADKEYEYYLPSEFDRSIAPGSLVVVPFGGGNKKVIALVVSLRTGEDISLFKPALSPITGISLTKQQIDLCFHLKDHLFCPIGDVVRAMIPSSAFSRVHEIYHALPEKSDRPELSQKSLIVWDHIRRSQNGISVENLIARFGKEVTSVLPKLIEYSYVEKISEVRDGIRKKEIETVHLKFSPEETKRYVSGDKKIVRHTK